MSNIRVFTMDGCPYCDELKERLTNMDIDFIELDVDLPENEKEYQTFYEITNSDLLPMVVVGKTILVGDKSFKTIEEAAQIVQKLNQ